LANYSPFSLYRLVTYQVLKLVSPSNRSQSNTDSYISHIRTDAKRAALDAIVQESKQAVFGAGVHQNVHQLQEVVSSTSAKPLN
jgi:hypothetical protein